MGRVFAQIVPCCKLLLRTIECYRTFSHARLKANLHATICRPDLSATISREANRFMYSASTAHALFMVKTFFKTFWKTKW